MELTIKHVIEVTNRLIHQNEQWPINSGTIDHSYILVTCRDKYIHKFGIIAYEQDHVKNTCGQADASTLARVSLRDPSVIGLTQCCRMVLEQEGDW